MSVYLRDKNGIVCCKCNQIGLWPISCCSLGGVYWDRTSAWVCRILRQRSLVSRWGGERQFRCNPWRLNCSSQSVAQCEQVLGTNQQARALQLCVCRKIKSSFEDFRVGIANNHELRPAHCITHLITQILRKSLHKLLRNLLRSWLLNSLLNSLLTITQPLLNSLLNVYANHYTIYYSNITHCITQTLLKSLLKRYAIHYAIPLLNSLLNSLLRSTR